jgi:PST family polysaccharide transporter
MSTVSSGSSTTEALGLRPRASSHFEILKSTALVGGSQVITIVIGIVRTKAMAFLLGPSGFGLMGLFSSIQDLTQTAAGLGLNSSGVRQIAASAGSPDQGPLARVAATLKRTSFAAGLLGAIVLVALAGFVSQVTFGAPDRRDQVAVVGLAVFFTVLAGGYGALIQGMRRIGDLARMAVISSLLGTVVAVALIAWLGEAGVVWGLASIAAANFACAWWFSRRISVPKPVMSRDEFLDEIRPLIGLGVAFMGSSLLIMGCAYAVRILLVNRLGLEATGHYQAAWTIGGLYTGLILQAMGSDFYPRLTAVSRDNARCNRLINEQASISFLVAGPGILATLIFAPLAIRLFYTAQFLTAVDTLRWLCLGIAVRLIGWPLGFLLLAKGAKGMFFLSDVLWTVTHITLAAALTRELGLPGVGVSFLAAYVLQSLVNLGFARRLSGFRWSGSTLQIGVTTMLAVACGFLLTELLPPAKSMAAGSILLVVTTAAAAICLQNLLGVPFWRVSEIRRRLSGSKADL